MRILQPHAGYVASEADIADDKSVMMTCMAGRIPGEDFDISQGHTLAVLHGDDAVGRRGEHGAPERVHLIAIDHAGAVHQA